MKQSKTLRNAFLASLPVMASYVVLGTGFGILLQSAGYGLPWALAMSILIYAGSLQYVGVGLITGGAGILATAVTSLAVNARHLFYSISMLDVYKRAPRRYRFYQIFALTDETYSIVVSPLPENEPDPDRYRFLLSLFNHCYWVTGSAIGALLGRALPFSTEGIEFSMTALFAVSFVEQWKHKEGRPAALCGLVITAACLFVFGRENFLIPALLLITLSLAVMRPFLEGSDVREKGGVA